MNAASEDMRPGKKSSKEVFKNNEPLKKVSIQQKTTWSGAVLSLLQTYMS